MYDKVLELVATICQMDSIRTNPNIDLFIVLYITNTDIVAQDK